MPAKDNIAASHEASRKKVCAPCGKKMNKGARLLNDNQVEFIVHHLDPDFSILNPLYPIGICSGCRLKFSSVTKDPVKVTSLSKIPNYGDMVLPRPTRDNPDPTCNCYVCLTGRDNRQFSSAVGGRGLVHKESVQIELGAGLVGASTSNTLPQSAKVKERRPSKQMCTVCKQEIGKGISHICTQSSSSNNVVEQVLQLPEVQQGQIVSALLKEKAKEQLGIDDIGSNRKNVKVSLSTKGAKASVVLNAQNVAKVVFPESSLDNLQSTLGNISNTHMKTFANFLRVHAGKKSVPSHYRDHVTTSGKHLADVYKKEVIQFENKEGKPLLRPVVWADATELLDVVCTKREFFGRPTVKVMADGGQGFLKICVSVLPEGYDPNLDRAPTDEELAETEDDEDPNPRTSKRSKYSEGGTVKKGKLTGVRKLIMVCIVPDVPETHTNMTILFKLTQLNLVSFLFVADFKLLLIVYGLQTATAKYPCPYCLILSDDMRDKQLLEKRDPAALIPEPRTFGKLEQDHTRFLEDFNGKKSKAMFANSTVNQSIIEEDSEIETLSRSPLEELHCLTGFVNHTFFDGLVKLIGRELAMKWPLSLNLVSKGYHGEVFEGNAARKLLRTSDKLLDPMLMVGVPPLALIPYVSAYKAMDKLVSSCFGTGKVTGDIPRLVDDLITKYLALDISITLKAHVLFVHLVPCLLNLNGYGLGMYSGQSGESIHREFLKNFWNKVKINVIEHPDYLQHLFDATVEFSSRHL